MTEPTLTLKLTLKVQASAKISTQGSTAPPATSSLYSHQILSRPVCFLGLQTLVAANTHEARASVLVRGKKGEEQQHNKAELGGWWPFCSGSGL